MKGRAKAAGSSDKRQVAFGLDNRKVPTAHSAEEFDRLKRDLDERWSNRQRPQRSCGSSAAHRPTSASVRHDCRERGKALRGPVLFCLPVRRPAPPLCGPPQPQPRGA